MLKRSVIKRPEEPFGPDDLGDIARTGLRHSVKADRVLRDPPCGGCSHGSHAPLKCISVPMFTREGRCGCTEDSR